MGAAGRERDALGGKVKRTAKEPQDTEEHVGSAGLNFPPEQKVYVCVAGTLAYWGCRIKQDPF